MKELKTGQLCPWCREEQVVRVHRQGWMNWLPKSKYYHCHACRSRFLTISGWAIPLPRKKTVKEED
ncbi:MAG: hypothetical protein NTY36_11430 [Deltaproteobacteria bacterium]|nr:hypothetical protein [Deltaproteobacteria bacterium]